MTLLQLVTAQVAFRNKTPEKKKIQVQHPAPRKNTLKPYQKIVREI